MSTDCPIIPRDWALPQQPHVHTLSHSCWPFQPDCADRAEGQEPGACVIPTQCCPSPGSQPWYTDRSHHRSPCLCHLQPTRSKAWPAHWEGGCCLWGCNAGISLQGRPPCAAEPELDKPVRGVNQEVFCGSRGEQPLEPCHHMFAMELMPGSRIVTSQGP